MQINPTAYRYKKKKKRHIHLHMNYMSTVYLLGFFVLFLFCYFWGGVIKPYSRRCYYMMLRFISYIQSNIIFR